MNITVEKSTDQVLQEMLIENTGTHLLDSGGAYGRAWEKNQGENFDNHPCSYFGGVHLAHPDKDGNVTADFYVVHDLYHWLRETVVYNDELTRKFNVFADLPSNEYKHYLELMEEFPEFAHGREAKGIYGEGNPVTVNSYNHEEFLSQVIQFTYWEQTDWHQEGHVLLQIHGGCDVRGGYTRPIVFDAHIEDSPSIFDFDKWGIGCTNCNTIWSREERGQWNGSEFNKYNNLIPPYLPELPAIVGDGQDALANCSIRFLDEPQASQLFDSQRNLDEFDLTGKVKLVIEKEGYDGEGAIFCPVCGKGKLQPWYY